MSALSHTYAHTQNDSIAKKMYDDVMQNRDRGVEELERELQQSRQENQNLYKELDAARGTIADLRKNNSSPSMFSQQTKVSIDVESAVNSCYYPHCCAHFLSRPRLDPLCMSTPSPSTPRITSSSASKCKNCKRTSRTAKRSFWRLYNSIGSPPTVTVLFKLT